MVPKEEGSRNFQRWPPAATYSENRLTPGLRDVSGVSAWNKVQSLQKLTEESVIWNQVQQWVEKGLRNLINVMWMLKMQKLAVLGTLRVCDSLCKKNVKPGIALVGAGSDSRPKGRFLWVQGQGESPFWLVALSVIDRLADTVIG